MVSRFSFLYLERVWLFLSHAAFFFFFCTLIWCKKVLSAEVFYISRLYKSRNSEHLSDIHNLIFNLNVSIQQKQVNLPCRSTNFGQDLTYSNKLLKMSNNSFKYLMLGFLILKVILASMTLLQKYTRKLARFKWFSDFCSALCPSREFTSWRKSQLSCCLCLFTMDELTHPFAGVTGVK